MGCVGGWVWWGEWGWVRTRQDNTQAPLEAFAGNVIHPKSPTRTRNASICRISSPEKEARFPLRWSATYSSPFEARQRATWRWCNSCAEILRRMWKLLHRWALLPYMSQLNGVCLVFTDGTRQGVFLEDKGRLGVLSDGLNMIIMIG